MIDGASTDSTLEILRASQHPALHWTSEADNGIAEAMNKGVKLAKGKWLLFLQADDQLIGPNSLQNAWRFLTNDKDLVLFDTIIEESPNQLRTWKVNLARYWRKMPGSHQGMFFRKSFFQKHNGFNSKYRYAMDYDLIYRMIEQKANTVAIPQTVTRAWGAGLTGQTDWDSRRKRFSEEKHIHYSNTGNYLKRIRSKMYWTIYYPYRFLLNRWL